MQIVTVAEAADRLRLSVRQVQRLARLGDLVPIGPDRLDWESVLRHEAARQGHERRAWEEATAWAAVALLERVEATWLGQAQRSRLKSELRRATAEELVARTRNRATVHRLMGHRAVVGRLDGEVIGSGSAKAVGDLTAATGEQVDGYVSAIRYGQLMARYRLHDASEGGNVTLRATGFDLEIVSRIAERGDVLAGLDLGASLDTRERAAGVRAVELALARFR
ncbi:hypothetical protein ACFS27_25950 [Promicromonospora vindobonensis]|uniref:Excisionase family DNA binding protein n=1 Tax=Promicromonospora vindobonensis TaxID=195748 RepID=A0ABW5VZS6_9MICO